MVEAEKYGPWATNFYLGGEVTRHSTVSRFISVCFFFCFFMDIFVYADFFFFSICFFICFFFASFFSFFLSFFLSLFTLNHNKNTNRPLTSSKETKLSTSMEWPNASISLELLLPHMNTIIFFILIVILSIKVLSKKLMKKTLQVLISLSPLFPSSPPLHLLSPPLFSLSFLPSLTISFSIYI